MTPSLSVSIARNRICSRVSLFCPFARPLPLPWARAMAGVTAAQSTMAAMVPAFCIGRLLARSGGRSPPWTPARRVARAEVLLKRLTRVGRAVVEAAAKPGRALLRRSVCELVGKHMPGRHPLNAIVANGRGRTQAFFEIAALEFHVSLR